MDHGAGTAPRHLDHALGTEDAGREGRVGVGLLVNRRSGAGEIEDDFSVDVHRLAHVAGLKVKLWITGRFGEVRKIAGHQVVEAYDLEAFGEQAVDQVGAQEAGGACHQRRSAR